MLLAVLLGMGMPAVRMHQCSSANGPLTYRSWHSDVYSTYVHILFCCRLGDYATCCAGGFAAATAKAEPMSTGFSAVRSGIVMFTIPFVFAFYPEILLIDQALIDPSRLSNEPLPGYESGIQVVHCYGYYLGSSWPFFLSQAHSQDMILTDCQWSRLSLDF